VSPAVLSEPASGYADELAALALARVGRFEEALPPLRALYRREAADLKEAPVPELVKEEVEDGTRLGVEGGLFDSFAWFAGPWDAPVTPVECPVWLWYGEADESVPPAQGEWYRDHLPQAELVVTPGANHPGAINPFKRVALDLLAGTLA
jgi:pimeloyl-ACP methyl ester carboxylesterase